MLAKAFKKLFFQCQNDVVTDLKISDDKEHLRKEVKKDVQGHLGG